MATVTSPHRYPPSLSGRTLIVTVGVDGTHTCKWILSTQTFSHVKSLVKRGHANTRDP